MTKAEFRAQFKRLRVSGYRLPVWDGVSVDDVLDEWYASFGACTLDEFAQAITGLQKAKVDTFWPATGEIWSHIFEVRRARKVRAESSTEGEWPETPETVRQQLAQDFRSFADRLASKMTMPDAAPQVGPDHVEKAGGDR